MNSKTSRNIKSIMIRVHRVELRLSNEIAKTEITKKKINKINIGEN